VNGNILPYIVDQQAAAASEDSGIIP